MKCCICGTVKNCGGYLDRIFNNMEQIGALFDNYVIIIYYDYSNDDTLQKIKDYQQRNNKLQFFVNKSPLTPYRTHNIAKGRNFCIQAIRNNYSDWDHFIMMDCDDVCAGNMNLDVLKRKLNLSGWDSLSFNRDEYYDIWALSIRPYIFSFNHFNNSSWVLINMRQHVSSLLNQMPQNGLLMCSSAFNGFAIYKTEKFLNCNYDGNPRLDFIPKNLLKMNMRVNKSPIIMKDVPGENGSIYQDCEHRSFHMEAINKNGARIRISPEKLF